MSKSEQRKHQYKTTKSLHESHEASKQARYVKNKQDRHFLIQRKRSLIEETHVDESISMSNLQSSNPDLILLGIHQTLTAINNEEIRIGPITINQLVHLLSYQNNEITIKVLWCFEGIAQGDHEEIALLFPLIPTFLQLLTQISYSWEIRSLAAIILSSIYSESNESIELLSTNNVWQPIIDTFLLSIDALQSVTPPTHEDLQAFTWSCSNFLRGGIDIFAYWSIDTNDYHTIIQKLLFLFQLPEIKEEVRWFFAFLTARTHTFINDLLNHGLLLSLEKNIHPNDMTLPIMVPWLRTLGNICCAGNEYKHQVLQNQYLLSIVVQCMDVNCPVEVIKDAIWVMEDLITYDQDLSTEIHQYLQQHLLEHLTILINRNEYHVIMKIISLLSVMTMNIFYQLIVQILIQKTNLLHVCKQYFEQGYDIELLLHFFSLSLQSYQPIIEIYINEDLLESIENLQYTNPQFAQSKEVDDLLALAYSIMEKQDQMQQHGYLLDDHSNHPPPPPPPSPGNALSRGRGQSSVRPAWMNESH